MTSFATLFAVLSVLTMSALSFSANIPSNVNSLGCYHNDIVPAGNGFGYTSSQMTVENCYNVCSLANLKYFALYSSDGIHGDSCYCLSTLSSQATIGTDASCTLPCEGDSTQTCGAGTSSNGYNDLYTYNPVVGAVDG
ncbi:hypothetical protein L207DRAFT_579773 [Hyaloscypha variabilis F]|uniref:WSC domain-containing protein n=1 Tax=Hyaloscypha variabilis (strain UAMH 11265 / GT02V1 / F) TaxID=1149755 RepID=A0A2J6RWN3_HYAVF|nr:hypothetical protein L207DRAFT_579773 [Hyaloscypha variabilis F]